MEVLTLNDVYSDPKKKQAGLFFHFFVTSLHFTEPNNPFNFQTLFQ